MRFGDRKASCSLIAAAAVSLVAAPSCRSGGDEPEKPAAPLESGSPWPKFRGNAVQDGATGVHPTTTGGAPWAFKTGKGIFSSPVVAADGTIYVGSADRTFYALNADGTVRWSVPTGEIIDSSALLDDRGRVYFGSGDGKLRALDAKTGAPVWTMNADDPAVNKAFINWFEGNVAIGPSGRLYVPNDNFSFYAIDRDTGAVAWSYRMPDQTWSLPAVDTSTETIFVGNNNLLPILGKNTFVIDKDGHTQWNAVSRGSVAASPMLTPDGAVVVGGFDGYVRAYERDSGDVRWEVATRDHVYASPARLPDGTIVQPSADGTIYALDPATGAQRWAFDTREPIRSSPAIDADGNVYVGSGEGRLFVLRPDGTLRWSMRLIDDDRNDLNSSPALGRDAIYLGGESGEVFSVPYDWCLRPEGLSDPRCTSTQGEGLPESGARLLYTSCFGAARDDAPTTPIDAHQPITLSLVVRDGGDTKLALLDTTSLAVTLDPPAPVDVEVAGDGKFVTITPRTAFAAAADGTTTLTVHGKYLVSFAREGLRLKGGEPGGDVETSLRIPLAPKGTATLAPGATWEIARLAIPLPTLMPSYNQIGFDSLHYVVGLVEVDGARGVGWMAGGHLLEGGAVAVDPATKALFPLDVGIDGDRLTMQNQEGLSVVIMNATLPFKTFRMAVRLGANNDATGPAVLSGSTICAEVPFYGPFLQTLGLCNPQTDVVRFFGGANVKHGAPAAAPGGVGDVTFEGSSGAVTATIANGSLRAADHLAAILLVDATTGKPVTLGYGLDTTRTVDAAGNLVAVSVPLAGHVVPKSVRAYLMIDSAAAAKSTLAIP